jgi:hypothetical protein
MNFDSEELEERLKALETKLIHLQKELSTTEKIAKQIQGLVTQNRFPQLQGIEFLSRYIPGEQNRAEGFDFFVNSQKSNLWFFYFSVHSYGLSTALFQTYLLLQSRTFFDNPKSTPEEALDQILKEFSPVEDPKARISVASLQLSTLKWEEANYGVAPIMFQRSYEKRQWGTPQLIDSYGRKKLQIAPGSRLFFLNKESTPNILQDIELNPLADQLKEDFNSFLFTFEKREKNSKSPEDICFWAIDISAKKIHLA